MEARLLCLLGPTAVGKTEIAIQLAQRLNAEIVSVDSRQIYRQMDIGTAKPTPEEQQAAPHHLIDCVDVSQPFSVADYQSLADTAIADIQHRGKQVILVGGAGLYFRAVVDGLFEGPDADTELRDRLEQEAAQHGGRCPPRKAPCLRSSVCGTDSSQQRRPCHPCLGSL